MESFYFIDEPFVVEPIRISDSPHAIPPGFHAVKIHLDGRADGSLDWKDSRKMALDAIGKGLKLFWEIDLGLFNRLCSPLSDETQFLALGLSLQHFRDTLWPELQRYSIGVSLYRGPADFSQNFPWDAEQDEALTHWLQDHFEGLSNPTPDLLRGTSEGEQLLKLFCSDIATQYIGALAQGLPDGITPFVLLDVKGVTNPFLLAQLVSQHRFGRIQRAITDGVISPSHLTGQQRGFLSTQMMEPNLSSSPTVGVCLPSKTLVKGFADWTTALEKMQIASIPWRLLCESTLTSEWEGLDYLLVMPHDLTAQGLRKLHGFCAAGGTVISLADPVGVAQELAFKDWINQS